uniref:Uncharacterized protein n=1 Tax=Cacopsylla melanoneura TaxID=428564 RepID=A0A8D8V383_9HEMI
MSLRIVETCKWPYDSCVLLDTAGHVSPECRNRSHLSLLCLMKKVSYPFFDGKMGCCKISFSFSAYGEASFGKLSKGYVFQLPCESDLCPHRSFSLLSSV